MSDQEVQKLKEEVSNLKELVFSLFSELKESSKEKSQFTGVAVKTSDLMNGFQGAMAKAIRSRKPSSDQVGEDIQNFIIQDMEVEFAVPLVAEREEKEPILMIPNIKSVTDQSPLVKLKFKVANVPEKEE